MSYNRDLKLDSADLAVFGTSVSISILIVGLSCINKLSHSPVGRAQSIQSVHDRATSRLGGIAIFVASLLTFAFVSQSTSSQHGLLMIAASVVFFAGLAEDAGLGVSPRMRLLASIGASCLAILLLKVWLPRADLWIVDAAIASWWFGIPLTILVTAGMAHAFNLLDGLHGLSSGAAAISSLCLAIMSDQAGWHDGSHQALMLFAGIMGFYILNFPFGLIFLGDGGAYVLGFILSWFGIVLLLNSEEVSAWAILLTMFIPASDVVLTICRRVKTRKATARPDRMHLHHVVFRALKCGLPHGRLRSFANPLATLVLLPVLAIPPGLGVMLWNDPAYSFFSVSFLIIAYFMIYNRLTTMFRKRQLPGMSRRAPAGFGRV